jgi:hypothetical protein
MSAEEPGFRTQHFAHLVANAILTRANFNRKFGGDPRKDIDRECGHPRDVSAEEYHECYRRDPIAGRVVDHWPDRSWEVNPSVYEDEDIEELTAFEAAWHELNSSLSGGMHEGEQGSVAWGWLHRLDVLSGIGRYGVLLLGLDDGRDLSMPAEPSTDKRLLYLRAFPETLAQISRYETNRSSPRYGQPLEYSLTLYDPQRQQQSFGTSQGTSGSDAVHWSRVIHVADNADSSEVFGKPRLEGVYNRILDLKKLYGASAEMFWMGAFMGIFFGTDPSLGGDVVIDQEEAKDSVENFFQGLQRSLFGPGLVPKQLAPQVSDPSSHIERQLEAISVRTGISKRVLMGSERGELSSSQDARRDESRARARRERYVTGKIIAPFFDRLIILGCLPVPASGKYRVWWPDGDTQTDDEKATVALKRTQALAQYFTSGASEYLTLKDYLTRWQGFDEADAVEMQEAADGMRQEREEKARMMAPALPNKGDDDAGRDPDDGSNGGTGLPADAR